MSKYRFDEDREAEFGEGAQRVRNLARRGSVETIVDEEIALVNIEVDDDGNVNQLQLEQFLSPGLISRPDPAIETECIVLNVGADAEGSVVVGTRDASQLAILDKEPLSAPDTMVYASDTLAENTKRILLSLENIRAGNLNGSEKSVAFKDDVESLELQVKSQQSTLNAVISVMITWVTAFGAHIHTGVTTGLGNSGPPASVFPPPPPPNTATATIEGTDIFLAE